MLTFNIKPTERVSLVGKTGCGKTNAAKYLLKQFADKGHHIVILDNKGMFRWKGAALVRSLEGCYKAQQKGHRIIVFRPPEDIPEGSKEFFELMNDFYWWVYKRQNCICYTDEATAVCDSHNMLPGHTALLKRGRELNIGCWNSTQQPVNVHNNIFSESEHFFVFRTQLESHREKLSAFMGDEVARIIPPKHHFWYFNPESMDNAEMSEPVPLVDF